MKYLLPFFLAGLSCSNAAAAEAQCELAGSIFYNGMCSSVETVIAGSGKKLAISAELKRLPSSNMSCGHVQLYRSLRESLFGKPSATTPKALLDILATEIARESELSIRLLNSPAGLLRLAARDDVVTHTSKSKLIGLVIFSNQLIQVKMDEGSDGAVGFDISIIASFLQACSHHDIFVLIFDDFEGRGNIFAYSDPKLVSFGRVPSVDIRKYMEPSAFYRDRSSDLR